MNSAATSALNDYVADVLVRYFRKAVAQRFDAPRLDLRRSEALLAQCWALSMPVRVLVSYLVNHFQEVQAVLHTQSQVVRDAIRGRIDARQTTLLHAVRGQPTWAVCITPSREYESGPNRVLCWVLKRTLELLRQRNQIVSQEESQTSVFASLLRNAESAMRFEPIRDAMSDVSIARRPGNRDLAEAMRSRRSIYRLAGMAYRSLLEIEAGDPAALRVLMNDTVLGPASTWQRFELAVGLSAAEALSSSTGMAVSLHSISAIGGSSFATVGRFSLHWQSKTWLYVPPPLEPSEKLLVQVLSAIGLTEGSDRPDFVVVDRIGNNVVALLEAKYFENDEDDGAGAIRAAADQLVRYSRGYRSAAKVLELIRYSAIAVSKTEKFRTQSKSDSQPWVFDVSELMRGEMIRWSREVVFFAGDCVL